MRQITQLPLSAAIAKKLKEKQDKINSGEPIPKKWWRSKFKNQIKDKLIVSQKFLCCYCECSISKSENVAENEKECHIEHFYERSDCICLIYVYENNLILSCELDNEDDSFYDSDSCGHYKEETNHERIPVDYNLLLNPMNDNRKLLKYNDEGVLEALTKVSSEIEQVDYTIQRLNLNNQKLKNKRTTAIDNLNEEIKDLNEQDKRDFLIDLLDESQDKLRPYFSTIKDNFGFILVN